MKIPGIQVGQCSDLIPGHGADFSFRLNRHVLPGVADLKLNGDTLIVGRVMTQGRLVSIGKIDIGELDLSSDAMKFLTGFIPANDFLGAEQQALVIKNGIRKNACLFGAIAPVVADGTYLLRTIAYRTPNDGGDKRRDLIVAFTVVRLDVDGNATLIWKILQEKESPKLSGKE